MDELTIISIAEFRKLSGLSTAAVTDGQAVKIIRQLDTMAQIYIKQVAAKPGKEIENG